jgi:hypothetical protein
MLQAAEGIIGAGNAIVHIGSADLIGRAGFKTLGVRYHHLVAYVDVQSNAWLSSNLLPLPKYAASSTAPQPDRQDRNHLYAIDWYANTLGLLPPWVMRGGRNVGRTCPSANLNPGDLAPAIGHGFRQTAGGATVGPKDDIFEQDW